MAAKTDTPKLYDARAVEAVIHVVRNTRAILDMDVARFYGVATRKLNHALERNADRFPVDFAFQLTEEEIATTRIGFAKEKKAVYRTRKKAALRSV